MNVSAGQQRCKPALPAPVRDCPPAKQDRDYVYAYYDRDDFWLYVGISLDPSSRGRNHRNGAPWWRFVAGAEVVEVDRADTAKIERECIYLYRPAVQRHVP